MTPLVFIDGDQGTTGLQVRQWLAVRQDLRLLQLPPEHLKSTAPLAEAWRRCHVALPFLPHPAAHAPALRNHRYGLPVPSVLH